MDFLRETYFIVLPIIATALFGWIGTMLKDQRKKDQERDADNKKKYAEVDAIRKANSEGIKLVLRYMLKRYHTEYTMQGKITYAQYQDWMDIYKAYHALGGNSIAEDWNKHIEELEKCDSIKEMTIFEAMIQETMDKQKRNK